MNTNPTSVFGEVKPSVEFLQKYGSGGTGLGAFLSSVIGLIYIIASVVLIFMMLWGALDWISSAGEKEKVEGARNKIVHAIIGFIILAITFAILSVLSDFTGIYFFDRNATP